MPGAALLAGLAPADAAEDGEEGAALGVGALLLAAAVLLAGELDEAGADAETVGELSEQPLRDPTARPVAAASSAIRRAS